MHDSVKIDSSEKDSGSLVGRMDWHLLLPFLLVGIGLLILCSLPGSSVLKQLMQMVTVVPGQAVQF